MGRKSHADLFLKPDYTKVNIHPVRFVCA